MLFLIKDKIICTRHAPISFSAVIPLSDLSKMLHFLCRFFSNLSLQCLASNKTNERPWNHYICDTVQIVSLLLDVYWKTKWKFLIKYDRWLYQIEWQHFVNGFRPFKCMQGSHWFSKLWRARHHLEPHPEWLTLTLFRASLPQWGFIFSRQWHYHHCKGC